MYDELGNISSDVNLLVNQRKVYFGEHGQKTTIKLTDKAKETYRKFSDINDKTTQELTDIQNQINQLRQQMELKFEDLDSMNKDFWSQIAKDQGLDVDLNQHEKYDLEVTDENLIITELPDDKLMI